MSVKEITKSKENVSVQELESELFTLLLYNDDYNTFDHVIDCLIKICNHDAVQAEQCAYLVHFTGKTDVKFGEFEILQQYKHALIEQGLSAVVEKSN